MKNLVAGLVLICFTSFSFGQITIDNTTLTPTQLVTNALAGTGVQILNVTFNNSAALATNPQVQVGYFNNNGTSFPLAEGVILGTGNTQLSIGPNNSGSSTNNTGVAIDPNDPDLNAIITGNANDECVLEFDFIPNGDTIVFNYIFASEEYHEYSNGTKYKGQGTVQILNSKK